MNKLFKVVVFGIIGLSVACNKGGAAAPAASPESCTEYTTKFCEVVGQQSPDCAAAQNLFKLLPASACAQGLADLSFTKTAFASARETCNTLVGKLCTDIGKDTQTCSMVTERTCLLYTSPSPRDVEESRMPSSA